MRYHLLALLVAVTFALGTAAFALSAPAHANRPVPGYHYKDVCKNIPGKQTILDTVGISARYRFNTDTPRPNDCVRVIRTK
jgi:hypothetical protein